MHKSIATIDSPEFINLQPLDINPLMSSCEIKVLYLGENRNHSYITKEVATEMAKTLRGAPIVGYFKNENNDFKDHGERIIFEDGDIKFDCLTQPYGFVAPNAKVWFKKFTEEDGFGNEIVREYLMTTGYLWTGQFEEAKLAADEDGRPQSMELDEKTLQGEWSTNFKTGIDFFIISDAIFSKLCILGEDVEPCFEGSSVSAQKVSTSFTKVDDNFKKTLYTMMQELQFALEGGQNMAKEHETAVEENLEVQDNFEKNDTSEIEKTTEETSLENPVEETPTDDVPSDFVKDEDKEDDEEKNDNSEEEKEDSEDEDDEKKKYSALEQEFTELKTQFEAMTAEYEKLIAFKKSVDDAKKDDLINSFYMLDDADKKEIIDNKSKYSLEDIEAKLSIIYTRKRMTFELEQQKKDAEEAAAQENVVTYSLAGAAENLPDWVKAVREVEEKMNF